MEKLKLIGPLHRATQSVGWLKPTPIQRRLIPLILKGKSVLASSPTGTGKTAAYALPLLHKVHLYRSQQQDLPPRLSPYAMVIVPVPELVVQVAQHMRELCTEFHTEKGPPRIGIASHGMGSGPSQEGTSSSRPEVLVATPGRVVHLVSQGSLDLSMLRLLVVDECERLMQLDLLGAMRDVHRCIPKPRKDAPMQAIMLSATLPEEVQLLAKRFAPKHTLVQLNPHQFVPRSIKHIAYTVSNRRKVALLVYLLRRTGSLRGKQVLIFVRTTQRADRIAAQLQGLGFGAQPLHSKISPTGRAATVKRFAAGDVQCVVATDAVARGLDVPELDYVLNLDIPSEPRDYVHRSGRTGRAGRDGTTINLVAREPQTVELRGRTVELSEKHFVGAIEAKANLKMEHRKVGGPWRDGADPVLEWDRQKSHAEALKLMSNAESECSTEKSDSTITLRNIEAGKYEDAIQSFNEKQARRAKVIKPVRKQRKQKRGGRSWVHKM